MRKRVPECTCGRPLPDWPALWVTSTNPAVECCSQDCAQKELARLAGIAREQELIRARDARDAAERARRAS